jgi:UDP-GlcNAc:undecaprenyl-phosphate GlcNAc-1-phosphate transferase
MMFVLWKQQPASATVITEPTATMQSESPRFGMQIGEWTLKALQLLVPLYLIVSVALPKGIPRDAGWVAIGLLVAVVASLVAGIGTPWVVRAGLYVGSTCLMYYHELSPRLSEIDVITPINIWFALLAGLVVLTIRFANANRFQTTPLDYLIVLLAVSMPFMPNMTAGDVPVSILAGKLIVLFFSFELLLHVYSSTATRLGWVSAWMLGGLVLRAWWS